MKKSLVLMVVAGAAGFLCAYGWFKQSLQRQHEEFAAEKIAWQAEKVELEAAAAAARQPVIVASAKTRVVEVDRKDSPAEILAKLKTMRIAAGQPRTGRLLVREIENFITCGPLALPVARDFIAENVEVEYDLAAFIKNARGGRLSTEFSVPPSLRLGVFEAVKNIGGPEAEKILAEALTTAGRGLEVAYLVRVLEQLAPGKYRAAAAQAALELLNHPYINGGDKDDRGFLFATLTFLNDSSFAAQAQTQLVQADGKVDTAALKYLQQTQPAKTLALALQAYQDPRVTDAGARERLAQVALETAGTNPMADNFFYAAMGDASLPADNRKNLAEDFADHGTNPNNPSPHDIEVMQKRLAVLDQLLTEVTEPLVIAGINEAQKDLNKFINKYAVQHPNP